MNIYISNLSLSVTEQQLKDLFSGFGTAHCSKIRTVSNVDKSKINTYAYIDMANRAGGEASITKLNNTSFQGSIIHVVEAN